VGGLVVSAALILVLAVVARRAGDPDIWWHLRTGQWILLHGALPATDLYTYTVDTHAWINHEYGTEILIALLFGWGGFAALSLAFAAIIWAGFLLILARIRMEPAPAVVTALVLGLVALGAEAVWGPRPQMMTFTLSCLELYWLEGFMRGRSRAVFALPLVVVGWANLHAGFVISLVFLALALVVQGMISLADRRDRQARRRAVQLAAVLITCTLAGAVNVHGFAVYGYAWGTQFDALQQSFVAEWQSPNFHDLSSRGMEVMLLLLLFALALRRPRLWDVGLAATTTLLALSAIRNEAIFVAAVGPILAWSYANAWRRVQAHRLYDRVGAFCRRRGVLRVGLAAVVVAAAGTSAFIGRTLSQQTAATAANFPVGAANWLAAHPSVGTHMLNASDWGGYLAYRFYPIANRRVFIYGEYLVMGDPLIQDIYDIEHAAPDWQTILATHRVDYVVERPNSPLSEALAVDPGWHEVYGDGFAVIFTR
jgi:hypothetical protein